MKTKRLLSLLLVMSMITGLLPAVAATASEAERTPMNYVFNTSAIDTTGLTLSGTRLLYTGFSGIAQNNIKTDVTDMWLPAGYSTIKGAEIAAGGMYWRTSAEPGGTNAFAIKLDVKKGTYIPGISYKKRKDSLDIDVYLVPEGTVIGGVSVDALKITYNDLKGSEDLKTIIAQDLSKYKLGHVPMYAAENASTAQPTYFESLVVDADRSYYLILKPTAKNANCTKSGSYYQNTITAFSFDLPKKVELKGIDIKAGEGYILANDADGMQLEVSGTMSDGNPADLTDAEITYESSDISIATVDEKGLITPVSCGGFALSVTVTLGEITLSKTVNLEVSEEPVVPSFEIYFNDPVARQSTSTLDYNGGTRSGYFNADTRGINWTVDKEKTAAGYYGGDFNSARIQGDSYDYIYLSGASPFAVKFNTATDGCYNITLSAMKSAKSGLSKFYIDGVYIGEFDGYSDTADINERFSVLARSIRLSAGEHSLVIKSGGKTGGGTNRYIRSIAFSGTDELPRIQYAEIEASRSELAEGESGDYKVKLVWENNAILYVPAISEDGTTELEFPVTSSDESVLSVSDKTYKALTSGKKASLLAKGTVDGINLSAESEITVNELVFNSVDFNLDENITYYVGGTKTLSAEGYLSDGSKLAERDITATEFESSDEGIAKIEDGKLIITGEGSTEITARITFNGKTVEKIKTVKTEEIKLVSITAATEDKVVSVLDEDGSRLIVSGANNDGSMVDITESGVIVENLNPELFSVDENGYVHFVSRGEGKLKVSFGELECETTVVSGSAKKAPTVYTYEMRETALENAKKYDWAKKEAKSAASRADKWVGVLDAIYEYLPGEGLPRSYTITTLKAPENASDTLPAMAYSCPYCKVDVRKNYGSYAWIVNPTQRPWKIQCPECKVLFPSNDFESFYELGLDKATGVFSRETALEEHHKLFGDTTLESPGEFGSDQWIKYYGLGVKGGYLTNNTFSDKGSTWMVDDGFGWAPLDGIPGSSKAVSANPKFSPIAFYMHKLWRLADDNTINTVLDDLINAYLYTGDVKYGRAGAIIIDRIADIYPSYDFTSTCLSYSNSHGSRYSGKILGSIWETMLSKTFVLAYDAFYPMMEDEQVIAYLSQKSAEYGMKNPKTDADMIRENCENGIVREAMEGLYTCKIIGNFGMLQYIGALCAVALDTYPESGEMLDWLCAPADYDTTKKKDPIYPATSRTVYNKNTGGELLTKYINDVDRDGFGNEVAIGYNWGWVTNTINIASLLGRYDKTTPISLLDNPKYMKMFDSIIRETLGSGYSPSFGDSGGTATTYIKDTSPETLMAFSLLPEGDERKIQLARNIYLMLDGELDDLYVDMFSDPLSLADEIEDIIEEYGEVEFESENLTGFGLAILRGGEKIKASGVGADTDFRGDTWMYYGRTNQSHAHRDMLQLGIDAYGFNFSPDLGYPEATSHDENRVQWIKNTLSHNTVVVDDDMQSALYSGTPLHFDSSGRVGVIDVDASDAYEQTDIYRRTAVSVAASDEVRYTIDFFRVKGGKSHTYSFHTQSYKGYTSDDLTLVPQLDENGKDGMYDKNGEYRKYTYAGVGVTYVDKETGETKPVLYGPDPNGTNKHSNYVTMFPRGYTWLTEVSRAKDIESGSFAVNFKQTDFRKQVSDSKGLNLKFIALNDWAPSGIGFATGYAPRMSSNNSVPGLDYMLIHRNGDEDLDTLYTSVLQPYKGEEYIAKAERIALMTDGTEVTDNSARAVKVTLKSGRTDYIVYSTADNVTYSVSDTVGESIPVSFNFRGFVGVYSVNEKGENIYSYANDGDVIGNVKGKAEYTGRIVSFTEELLDKNTITVQIDGEVDLEKLKNRYIYVENDKVQNGSYRILSASVNADNSLYTDLYLGNTTLIRGYKDAADFNAGYVYNIEAEQSFTIPLSVVEDFAPEIDEVRNDITTSAGSTITVNVNAEGADGEKVTYIGTVLPRGASVNSETGVVTWKPDASQVGESGFMITARDESGRESSVTFEVVVYGATTGGKNETTEPPSTGASGGGGGGGGAAPDTGNNSDTADDAVQSTEKAPDASGETDNIRFTDLGNHEWAENAINTLAADGIIKGTTASTFSPASNITRADFALLLVRAFNLESDNTENFEDVSANDYFATELAVARNTGIVNGIGDNKFAPRNTITRQDMMVITYRALQALGTGETLSSASQASLREVAEQKRSVGAAMNDSPVDCQNRDVTESQRDGVTDEVRDGRSPTDVPAEHYPDWENVAPYARDAVASLIGAGLVNGKNNLIAPTDYTTRAEVAVLIKRILDYTKK